MEEADQDGYRMQLGARIGLAIAQMPTKSEASRVSGVSTEQINKWVKGSVKVPADALKALSDASGVDFSWLVTGAGEMIPRLPRSRLGERLKSAPWLDEPERSDFIRLPWYEISASAGPGLTLDAELKVDVIAFDRQFLRDKGAAPDHCSVIRARGDSMTPTIPDGSLLVVDHSQREVANGCITVIGVGDDLLVKRIRRRLDGMIELISDNAAYAPEVIAADRLEQLRIVGRVIYFCRTP